MRPETSTFRRVPDAALCTDDPQDTVTAAPQESAQYCIDNAWG